MEAWQEFRGRKEELDVLNRAWERAQAGEAQCVVLLADSGYGKTRLIHEFYRQLSASASDGKVEPGYWPSVLSTDPTKIDINPNFSEFESQGDIPWLWWGMRWACPDDRNQRQASACAMLDFRDKLDRHTIALINRRAYANAGKDAVLSTAKVAMDFLPLPNLLGMAHSGKEAWDSVRKLWQKRERAKEAGFDERKTAEDRLQNAIALLQTFLDPKVKDVDNLPVILVMDDAQWADPMSLKFAHDLFTRARVEKWPLLLLVTHWESEWNQDPQGRVLRMDCETHEWNSFRDFEATISSRENSHDAIDVITVGKLQESLIAASVTSGLPGLEPRDVDYILKRSDGNMLICEEFIKILQDEPRWFVDENVSCELDDCYVMISRTKHPARKIELINV